MHAASLPSRSAFTLVEILLGIGVTMILFLAAMQTVIGSSSQLSYINTSNKVLDMIRQARSLAISGKAQLDHTDFDDDQLNYLTPAPNGPDQVTPANYGVYLHHLNNNTDEAILFADNHGVAAGGVEGKFDLGPSTPNGQTSTDFVNGYDIILEKFTLPKDIHLVFLPNNATSIFYSPIFADVKFDPSPAGPQFIFGFDQNTPTITRKGCFLIHISSGIPESTLCSP